jgi:sugar lactone lactonase YvrE
LVIAVGAAAAMAGEPAVIDADARFPEGPAYLGEDLLYAEYGAHKVSRWDGSAKSTFWAQDGCGPSAVVPLGATLLVTCYDNGTLVALDAGGAVMATWDADGEGMPLVGPNDATPDGRGGAFVTASGPWESAPIVGKVYHLSAEGALRTVADDLHYANGVALAPDGGRLFVAESEAGRVISFAVSAEGGLTDRRLFVRLFAADPESGAGAYPDGIEFGPDGNLYIGQYSSGRILAIAPDATLAGVIEVPSAAAPNLAFAPDGRIMVTAVDDTANPPYAGKVYAVTPP